MSPSLEMFSRVRRVRFRCCGVGYQQWCTSCFGYRSGRPGKELGEKRRRKKVGRSRGIKIDDA